MGTCPAGQGSAGRGALFHGTFREPAASRFLLLRREWTCRGPRKSQSSRRSAPSSRRPTRPSSRSTVGSPFPRLPHCARRSAVGAPNTRCSRTRWRGARSPRPVSTRWRRCSRAPSRSRSYAATPPAPPRRCATSGARIPHSWSRAAFSGPASSPRSRSRSWPSYHRATSSLRRWPACSRHRSPRPRGSSRRSRGTSRTA